MFLRKRRAQDWIIPEFKPQLGRRHDLRSRLRQVTDTNYLNHAWSGAAIQGGGPWTQNLGLWEIPTVSQPSEPQGNEGGWNSSSWIGIDGSPQGQASNDVLQAGVEQKVDASGNPSYIPWYEWYAPKESGSPSYIYQTNFDLEVSPGNQVWCQVSYLPVPFLNLTIIMGLITFGNLATNQSVPPVLLWPPPGATVAGNSVEWIMEAPDTGYPVSSLPEFTPVAFQAADGSNNAGGDANPQNGITYNIDNAVGTVLTSTTVGPYTVTIDFIG